MRISQFLGLAGAALMALGAVGAHAAVGGFYDPSNLASPTGKTIGYELFRTIGCPGRELLGVPCAVPDGDKDGVYDEIDKCPTTPAGRSPSLRSGVAVKPSSTCGRTACTKASNRSAARR